MKGAGHSIREIARELDISRNTVRRYLKSPEAMRLKPRPPRRSELDPYTEYIDHRMAEGLENCVALHREIKARGYQGCYSMVVQYVRPWRRQRQPEATMRLETGPGEQAQVDWGSLSYIGEEEKKHRVWVFVMTMATPGPATWSWSGGRTRRPSSNAASTPSSTWAGCPGAVCTTTPR